MPKHLAIIDGKSVFYRGYYAMPTLSTKDGTPTGGVYGFASLALELIKKLRPDYVAVAWDKPKTNIRRRREIHPEYKAGRKPAPPDFYDQIPILHELLDAFSWPLYELDDYEADDIMGALARKATAEGLEVSLISSDLDMLQCIGPHVHMYALKNGLANIQLFHPESFEEKYSIKVEQFLDYKSLVGDSSDNLPGVPGVGPVAAKKLLNEYGTLDGVYKHIEDIQGTLQAKLVAGKESAYMSRQVAQIWFDAPVDLELDRMDVHDLDAAKLKQLLTQLEFRTLLRNLPEHMRVLEETERQEMREKLKPVTAAPLDEAARVSFTMAKVVVLHPADRGVMYASTDPEHAYQLSMDDVVPLLGAMTGVVAYDSKELYRRFLAHDDTATLPPVAHDIRQATFLLDPLRKMRTLADVTGLNVDDPEMAVSAVWQLYTEQTKSLDELPRVAHVARTIDFPLIPILARMEHRGIRLDVPYLTEMGKDLQGQTRAVKQQMFDMVGYEFNISSPAQLAEVLFGKLQLPTVGIKRGKTGFSTGQKELDKLRGQHPIVELIEQYRELTKLQNTYIDALPKLADRDSRLHTTFNQDVAATGRLSSTDPNLQNIPIRSEIGRKIRYAFVPEKGNVFVSADYSQFELRLAAVLSGDQELVNDFNAGVDIHAKTASDVYKIPLEQVTKDQRRDAKVINFGVLYGMSPHGLSAATGMSFHDAKVFIDEYFRLRAPIRRYIDETIAKAKTEGYVETLYGRRRPTPDINSSNFIVREAAKRAAANMPIQGTEADLMKMAMIAVEARLKDAGVQVLQIHDSILAECREDHADEVATILRDTMEGIAPDLGISLKVDVGIGKSWGEL